MPYCSLHNQRNRFCRTLRSCAHSSCRTVLLFRIPCQPIASDTYPVTGVLVIVICFSLFRLSCRCIVHNCFFRAWKQLQIPRVGTAVIITLEMLEDLSGCARTTSSEWLGDVAAERRDVFQVSLQ